MSDSPIPVARPIDSAQPLSIDTPCIHCGYNLRGLQAGGRCPECGGAVIDSTRGNLLCHTDPDWLDTLRKGATLKLWNVFLAFPVVISGTVGATVFSIPEFAFQVVGLVGRVLGLWATFLITTQEPRVSLGEDPLALRRVIRGCAIVSFLGILVPGFGPRWSYTWSGGGNVTFSAAASLSGLWLLTGVVVYFGELIYLRRFARRIPDERLTKSTTIILWLLPAVMALLAVTGVIAWGTMGFPTGPAAPAATGAPPTGTAIGVMAFAFCSGGLFVFVMIAYYFRLLFLYRKAFAGAAALSRSGDSSE